VMAAWSIETLVIAQKTAWQKEFRLVLCCTA
jgi:hypothetical protein